MKLVVPDIFYKESCIAALHESLAESISQEQTLSEIKNIEDAIQHKLDAVSGVNLRRGEVARSEFWLIDDEKYIGNIQIRYSPSGRTAESASHIYYEIRPSQRKKKYGTEILKRGLMEASILGLSEVIITCEKGNIPSQKIIEANGGEFLEEIRMEGGERPLLKYRIALPE